jgi:hypothetical protein
VTDGDIEYGCSAGVSEEDSILFRSWRG